MFLVGKVFNALVISVPYIFVPHMMTLQDISSSETSLAMSVLAVSNGLGRLLSGLSTNYPNNVFIVQGIFGSIATLCMFVLPHCSNVYQFCVTTGIYGISIAPLIVLNTTALVNIVGMDSLSTAFGMMATICGFSGMIGPTVIGMMHDCFENYQIPFYMAGTTFGVSAAFSYITSRVHFSSTTNSLKNCSS